MALVQRIETKKATLAHYLKHAGFKTQQEQFLNSISSEVLESSLIENEVFSAQAVRSSIARKLGIDPGPGAPRVEKRAEGIIQVLLEATQNYTDPLTETRILGWHCLLMAHDPGVVAGEYRTDPIYVRSGSFEKELVHFEGPPPERVPLEMQRFVQGLAELDRGSIHPWLKRLSECYAKM